MEHEQLWESLLQRTESELLQPETQIAGPGPPTSITPHLMSADEIRTFIELTASSHDCDPRDISYYYEPIIGDDGNILLGELSLVFNMKSLSDGVLIDRAIHTIRVAVPIEVQQQARAMLAAMPEATAATSVAEPTPPTPAPAPTRTESAPVAASEEVAASTTPKKRNRARKKI